MQSPCPAEPVSTFVAGVMSGRHCQDACQVMDYTAGTAEETHRLTDLRESQHLIASLIFGLKPVKKICHRLLDRGKIE